jgi:hypothetical protein
MSDTQTIDVSTGDRLRIGLVVRGKSGEAHHPGLMEQHADAILSDGAPIGFYGETNDGMSNGIGLGMKGVVYDYAKLRVQRPYYVDRDQAVVYSVVSTVLLVDATAAQAEAFKAAWDSMSTDGGSFNIVGGNCSTHASLAFVASGIVNGVIPGLDTPDRLYAQLVATVPAAQRTSITGFIGFVPRSGGGYSLEVAPYAEDAKTNTPNRGSSSSF